MGILNVRLEFSKIVTGGPSGDHNRNLRRQSATMRTLDRRTASKYYNCVIPTCIDLIKLYAHVLLVVVYPSTYFRRTIILHTLCLLRLFITRLTTPRITEHDCVDCTI